MAKLQAKKIAEALKRAQRVGEVEEAFTVSGCDVVLRSLRPAEYEAAMAAVAELEDVAYIQAFKLEHISRSIVELNGESFRDHEYVEVDVEELDNSTGRAVVKPVTLELYQFFKEYVLSTWSREAIDVAFRKWNDVVAKAERVAAENITFTVPDETDDDKYRRLLGEAKALEPSVPFELAAKIRDEFGYALKQEYMDAGERLAKLEGGPGVQVVTEEELAATKPAPDLATRPVGPASEAPPPMQRSTAAILRPGAVVAQAASQLKDVPQVLGQSVGQLKDVVPAIVRADAAAASVPPPETRRKADEIAALEGTLPQDMPSLGATPQTAYNPHAETRPQSRNPEEAKQIIDKPPVGGINPRFRPPPRL